MSEARIHDYGKVWNYDDAACADQFAGATVEIEEKVDGSQFSASVVEGQLLMRSKGVQVYAETAGMFSRAVASCGLAIGAMKPGWVYRFEYLAKPKHNTLCYGRVPKNHLILLDVESPRFEHEDGGDLLRIAEDLGVDRTPTIYAGPLPTRAEIGAMLDRESFLGGCKVEGVVIKARDRRHAQDGKMLKAKVVSGDFKERHSKEWKLTNTSTGDIVLTIADDLRVDARFRKAVEAARDAGELEGSVRDIGPLMKRLGIDMNDEHSEYVRERLFKHFWPQIQRRANAGFPEWYKAQLSEQNATVL